MFRVERTSFTFMVGIVVFQPNDGEKILSSMVIHTKSWLGANKMRASSFISVRIQFVAGLGIARFTNKNRREAVERRRSRYARQTSFI